MVVSSQSDCFVDPGSIPAPPQFRCRESLLTLPGLFPCGPTGRGRAGRSTSVGRICHHRAVGTDGQRRREPSDGRAAANRAPADTWEAQLDALVAEAAAVKAAGRWRTGPRTLLQVLGAHELERRMVDCLAWVLGVLPREVEDAAGWRVASECGVRAVVIVGVEPGG